MISQEEMDRMINELLWKGSEEDQAMQAMARLGEPEPCLSPAVDISTMAMDIFQLKKMLRMLFEQMKVPIPEGVIDDSPRQA